MKPRTMMLYAESGDTKTSQLYHISKWFHSNFPDKRVRLVSSDGGGFSPFEDSNIVRTIVTPKLRTMVNQNGWVDVADIRSSNQAYAEVNLLSEGYWYDDEGNIGGSPNHQTISSQNVGMYLFDGITSLGKMWLGHLSHKEDGNTGFKHSYKFTEGDYSAGGLQEGHYGLLQTELYRLIVRGFGTLPIQYCVWTGRVGKGEKKRSGETVYGPQGVGNADTSEIPSWFEDCLHLCQEEILILKDNQEIRKEAKVAHFLQHKDKDTGIPYLCKPRVLPELYPKLLKRFPGGIVPLTFAKGIVPYLEVLEELRDEARKGS